MVWSQLKHNARRLNIRISKPYKVVNLVCDVYDQKVTVGKWKNYVAHIMKEEKTLLELDHVLDGKIEPLAFHLSDGCHASNSDDELV